MAGFIILPGEASWKNALLGQRLFQPAICCSVLIANIEALLLTSGEGSGTLYGGTGDDVIYGAEGDDLIEGGLGKDILHGDHGDGWYSSVEPVLLIRLTGGPALSTTDFLILGKFSAASDCRRW